MKPSHDGISIGVCVALLSGALIAPAVAAPIAPESTAMRPGPVRNLTVKVINRKCFRLNWQTPFSTNGSQYLVRVRGANTPPSYDFRSSTWKTKLRVCGLPENSYTAWVRQLGGAWTYESFDLGNPW